MNKSGKTSFVLKFIFFLNILIGVALCCSYLSTHISPNSVPYISFLGLAYPVLLLLVFVFSVFWLLFKRKYIIFNIAVFLLGWNHFTDFYAFSNSSKIADSSTVKVMSYNVRIFNYYDVKNRIQTRNDIFDLLKYMITM